MDCDHGGGAVQVLGWLVWARGAEVLQAFHGAVAVDGAGRERALGGVVQLEGTPGEWKVRVREQGVRVSMMSTVRAL